MKAPLPIVDGVGPSRQWLPPGPWKTIIEFLHERFPSVGPQTWALRMANGHVVDETGRRLNSRSAYRVGACVFYYRESDSEDRIPFNEHILYADEHLLVVDKPHFLPVIPAGRFLHETLLVRLRKQGKRHLVPIHRLDRDTAGLVLFSINPKTRGDYTALFRQRKVEKTYEAVAPALQGFDPPVIRRTRVVRGEPFFCMKEVAGDPNSETHIEVLRSQTDLNQSQNALTRYRLRPTTGKKHQLRLHLAGLGIPIINDRLYPIPRPIEEDDFSKPLKLLARSLSFSDPVTREERYFESLRTL